MHESAPLPSAEAASFIAFYLRWAEVQGWVVPDLHLEICQWLAEEKAPERVLLVFRGAAKSTLYAIHKAWRLWRDRRHRSLVWSADGPTAGMLTADAVNVLRNHPWCAGMLPSKPGARRFWVNGSTDARNASMRAVGVEGNATGARADDVDFDDVEVPGNIETIEARAKLRQRISESTHIAVPGAQKTYIGTPHTHDSIYPERIAAGAALLKIPLFRYSERFTETSKRRRFPFPHPVGSDGIYVMAGIYKTSRMLRDGVDYVFDGEAVIFHEPPVSMLDICSVCAWPERFDRKEVELRRRETRTINAWDSQYMLEAKPLTDIRLNPERMSVYREEPTFDTANRQLRMWLGQARIVGASLRWDPSAAKPGSDVSALALVFQDQEGRRYWHRAIQLEGDIAEFDHDEKTINGGQVKMICDVVERYRLPRVTVETNGIGGFAPRILKQALAQRGIRCGVAAEHEARNKNKAILESFEPLLATAGMLWAHESVIDGPAYDQMIQWNPAVQAQPDDYLDAGAKAIADQPERIGGADVRKSDTKVGDDWRPGAGTFEVELTI